ncbi:alpha-mannosidase [Candidatus Epulonipiscium viviparus]|uniref:alpha-mannosidase n=1 Tax=Candidatus Epulonipiscium viviparus TaxID=420336 RepID=UPI00273815E7|nr:glycoside hydrolase family 38 C-terminal domain-containing protein [Candidatus Epulopiscium viviparus]
MLNQMQLDRMIEKQRQYIDRMEKYIFKKVASLDVAYYCTKEHLAKAPQNVDYKPIKQGEIWGGEKTYYFFKTSFTVPQELDAQKLYLMPNCSLYEGLLFVNGMPYANYAAKYQMNTGHGNHYCKAFVHVAEVGKKYELVLEAYTGHDIEGCYPYEKPCRRNYDLVFDSFDVMVTDELVKEFYYDYKTLMELYDCQEKNSAKRAEIESILIDLNQVIYFSNEETDDDAQREALPIAREIMSKVLNKKNSQTVARVGILGHSHMDTAWLWEIDETIKKCARTYANQINMIEQFEDYHFIQSSAAHLKFIEIYYPELFEAIKGKIREGRYEPNGGVWVECDCNITGGEFMIRQFLWGQRYTMKHFDYKSNTFFLPDTFGYCAAIPQILKGCDIKYFLTTKMDWNDTNKFPYVTYYWQGIDGSKVLAHHNVTNRYPTPIPVTGLINEIQQKSVSNERLLTYGHGDGGGGPEDSSVEMAKRLYDLEGCPQLYNTTVGDFMDALTLKYPNTYVGELYLELHRGTLTNQHTIKRNNRKAEVAIRDAEYFTSVTAFANHAVASSEKIAPLVETLLINQFHDILPGTCVPEAHDRSIAETTEIIRAANSIAANLVSTPEDTITLYNTLSHKRSDVIEMAINGYIDAAVPQQRITKLDGTTVLHVGGIELDGFSSKTFNVCTQCKLENSAFKFENNVLTTPFAVVTFAENGSIESFVDTRNNRELRGEGHNLNTFLFGEDLSLAWDNWDIDADAMMNLEPALKLTKFEIVADGAVEFRIRTAYELSKHSTLSQDIIFYATSPRVDFDNVVDWNEKHRLLKVIFDTTINTDYATQEIQFGNLRRTTKANNSYEQAQFEVCNHKYTDLSEPAYGVAILNDCKYGISVNGSAMALSLHKGGCKPDPRGDKGVHEFVYSFYPHMGGFKAETVCANAYELNYPVKSFVGGIALPKLLSVDMPNIVVESLKPCEDNEKALIARIYECEGSYTNVSIRYHKDIKEIVETNMLEMPIPGDANPLVFKPYQIRTFKLVY